MLVVIVSVVFGVGIDKVIVDVMSVLEVKWVQLGLFLLIFDVVLELMFVDDGDIKLVLVIINNYNGLYVCLVLKLVVVLVGFNVDLLLEKNGKCVKLDSFN